MKFTKQDIQNALKTLTVPGEGKNMIESQAVKNIVVFGDEVVVDITISNPSLQAKKRTEVDIMKTIHELVYPKAKIQVNVKVEANKAPKNEIKGKPIPGVKHIIAIASGKGGVGKSTITSNMAVTLAKMGFKVGVLDADIYGPSIPLMFDVALERPLAVQVNGASKMQPVENYGVKILSIGFFTKPNQAVVWRGPMAAKALNQMIFDAAWGELDFLLIDLPPGTGDIHLSIMQSLPITGAVVVSTPQNVALADAKKGVAMFQQESINVPVLGIIENMATHICSQCGAEEAIFGDGGGEQVAQQYQTQLLGSLPLDRTIREQGDNGNPELIVQNKPEIAEAYKKIAQQLLAEFDQFAADSTPEIVFE